VSHASALAGIWRSTQLAETFHALADCGGRFTGTPSEARACALLRERLAASAPGALLAEHRVEYPGWRRERTTLALAARANAPPLRAHSLVWSPPTPRGGLEAEVLDLGRGTPEMFDAAGARVAGRLVLVRHEYPFAAGTIHRRRKYQWARERGAAGFLIASPLPGGVLVTGSSGRGETTDIPAAGVCLESAAALAGAARAKLEVDVRRGPAEARNLILEIPGRTAEWVVLSAHYDGHDLAESALDNATGVAAVLELVRAFGPEVPSCRRGLRAVLFTVEEWGLYGSERYVAELGGKEREAIALNLNLDTLVGGGGPLAALVSGFAELDDWVGRVARDTGLDLRTVLPLMSNSDHASFAAAGIPALRLLGGFDDPLAPPRYVLTAADTRDKVSLTALKAATLVAAELLRQALDWPGPIAAARTR
jgi:Iap family predicted aminopeptidase